MSFRQPILSLHDLCQRSHNCARYCVLTVLGQGIPPTLTVYVAGTKRCSRGARYVSVTQLQLSLTRRYNSLTRSVRNINVYFNPFVPCPKS